MWLHKRLLMSDVVLADDEDSSERNSTRILSEAKHTQG
jgi:hypothetical protein